MTLAALALGMLWRTSAASQDVGDIPGSPPPASAPRVFALIIGIDGYAERPLRYCTKDATALADTLQTASGIPAEQVLLVVDGPDGPTGDTIRASARRLAERAGEHDVLLVYFSGHGASLDGVAYLAPRDGRLSQPKTLIPINELRQILGQSRAAWRILILDACHSGGIKGDTAGTMSQAFEDALRNNARGFVTLASCRANEASLEAPWHGHGLFTHWLLLGLRGRADREGAGNRDQQVGLIELYQFVYGNVSREVAHRGGAQHPIFSGVLEGDFVLARAPNSLEPPVAAPAHRDEIEARIRRRVPLAQIEVTVLDGGPVELRGVVLSAAELRALQHRLAGMDPPVSTHEVIVRPDAVAQLLVDALQASGAQVREWRVRRQSSSDGNEEHVIDVELRAGGYVDSRVKVREFARQFVLDPERVRPTVYPRAP